jgi:Holliday junction resolvasome RuvABC endonuclease subunit
MLSLGIDGALTKPIAIASLDDRGDIRTRTVPVPKRVNGAPRLAAIRSAMSVVVSQFDPVVVVVVETPYGRRMSRGLMSSLQAQGVILEAVQAALPGALVLDLSPDDWKKHSVGHVRASKDEYILHAQGLGLDSDDEDRCAATCMAQAGMELWLRETRSTHQEQSAENPR